MAAAKMDPQDFRSVDPVLSNISIAYHNTLYIADIIAPVIPGSRDGGKFMKYNQADWFRNEAGKRGPGSRAKRGDYGITFGSYVCEEVAFAKEIPDEIRRTAPDLLQPDESATNYATDKVQLNKEVRVATLLRTAGTWATNNTVTKTGAGQWNNYENSDPISDIAAGVDMIASMTGVTPNTIIIPKPVWRKLQHHPDILERIKYSQRGVVTMDLLKEFIEIDRVLKGDAIYTQSNEGVPEADVVYEYVWGRDVWLGYITPTPGLQTPTAMYQFAVNGLEGRRVRRWREEPEHQDVVEAFELTCEQAISNILGYLIKDAVAA